MNEEKLKKLEPKNKIMFDEDGMPMIVVPPINRPPFPFQIHFFEFEPPKHGNFTKLQQQKEKTFLDRVLKDLEEIFKGWF